MTHPPLIRSSVAGGSPPRERIVWALPAPAAPATALVFLDGEIYIERVGAPAVVRQLQEAGAIPSTVALFVSHGGAAARHQDFTCCPAYADFVADDLAGWVRREYESVREIALVGLSLSGLAAAGIALRHPRVFRAAVCQSPSFWWERGRFAQELLPAAPPRPEFWISVGSRETETGVSHPPSGLRQEQSQIAGCAAALAALRRQGYEAAYREFDGGHDPDCWREDLALALPWLWRRSG